MPLFISIYSAATSSNRADGLSVFKIKTLERKRAQAVSHCQNLSYWRWGCVLSELGAQQSSEDEQEHHGLMNSPEAIEALQIAEGDPGVNPSTQSRAFVLEMTEHEN